MFLVVYVHSSFMFDFTPDGASRQAGLFWFTSILALVCNALFFMVSGKFNLAQAIGMKLSDYRIFYIKKVIDLLLPIAVYAIAFWVLRYVAMNLFGAWNDGTNLFDYVAFFEATHQLLISGWWFVPTIFSLMIFTPFLGRMLSALSGKETYLLLAMIFGCAALVAIEKLLGHTTFLSKFTMPIIGIWASVYILGYVIDKINFSSRALSRLYIFAIAEVVIVGAAFVAMPDVFLSPEGGPSSIWNAVLLAVFYPVIGSALYLFFKNITITGNAAKRIAEAIGNRAFGIYLIHFCFYLSFLHLLPTWLREADDVVDGIAKRLVITVIVFAMSFVTAAIIDKIFVYPIQKRLKARFLVKLPR